jgi:S1-C subfamily serine protease
MGMRTVAATCLSVLLLLGTCLGQSNGVPLGLIRRTLYIKAGGSVGTGFAIQYKGKQYLVTARHVVASLARKDAVFQIYRTGDWRNVTANILSPKNEEVDIAVLELKDKVASDEDASFGELSAAGINLGGEVYFLGYPHGLHSLFGSEYVPFIKKGVLSAIDDSDETAIVMYVDGFNNEGFSGGPVVFFDPRKSTWHLAGVVQGFLQERAKVRVNKQNMDTSTLVNSGILIAYSIKHVLQTIDPESQR